MMMDAPRPMNLQLPKAQEAFRIIQKLAESGFSALFAGGCVRDHLLGNLPTDYDIATNAAPEEVEKLFQKTIPVGKQFGVILVLAGGMEFEVATFRTEGGYQDGRRPGFVKFTGAEEDARRRDFTVNGLFYDPLQNKILDYVNGQDDLKRRVIRCIGNPAERFEEDKLRLLRAIRFAARLNFSIEDQTWNEIQKRSAQINIVSKERIRDELEKIMSSPQVYKGLKLMVESGLWHIIFKGVAPAGADRLEKWPSAFGGAPFILAVLLQGQNIGPEDLMRGLRFSNQDIANTQRLLDLVESFTQFSHLREGRQKQILGHPDFTRALDVYKLTLNKPDTYDALQAKKDLWKNENLRPDLLLSGDDLLRLGALPGPQVGKILEEAHLQQLEGVFQNRDQALKWAESYLKKGSGNA